MARRLTIDWDAQPIGLFPDGILGRNLGVTAEAVHFQRKKRGVPACRFPSRHLKAREKTDWDALPLGKKTDREIAEMIGGKPCSVAAARSRRGIRALKAPKNSRFNRVELGPLLGTKTDREIAELTGYGCGQISDARRAASIPGTRIDWTKETRLGTMPDQELADLCGVNHTVVAGARWRQGIPKWREERVCLCLTPFVAWARRQRFCSRQCASYWWTCITRVTYLPEVADLLTALWGYKRSIHKRGARCGKAVTISSQRSMKHTSA